MQSCSRLPAQKYYKIIRGKGVIGRWGGGKRDIKKGEGGRSAIIYRVLNLDIHSEIAFKLLVSAFGQ